LASTQTKQDKAIVSDLKLFSFPCRLGIGMADITVMLLDPQFKEKWELDACVNLLKLSIPDYLYRVAVLPY
jgi:hypothetical protein